jgi:hypothetical protein
MTLPDERFRSIQRTEEFLEALTNPQKTSRIPKEIREQARWCLRHYPSYHNLKELERAAPNVIQERMEDVSRMIKYWEEKKKVPDEN